MNDYELDPEELEEPKPLSAERKAEIQNFYDEMAATLAEINGY